MTNRIIDEFIEGTPLWVEQLKRMEEIGGRKMCVMCGVQPEKMLELIEAIKELREKAWKYDDLNR